jgi:hypothetical protein
MHVFMVSSQGLIDASRDLYFGRADHRARELAIDRNFRFQTAFPFSIPGRPATYT